MFDQFEPELDSDDEGLEDEVFVEDDDDDGDEDGYDDSGGKRKPGNDGPRDKKKRRLSPEDGTQSVCPGQNTLDDFLFVL